MHLKTACRAYHVQKWSMTSVLCLDEVPFTLTLIKITASKKTQRPLGNTHTLDVFDKDCQKAVLLSGSVLDSPQNGCWFCVLQFHGLLSNRSDGAVSSGSNAAQCKTHTPSKEKSLCVLEAVEYPCGKAIKNSN